MAGARVTGRFIRNRWESQKGEPRTLLSRYPDLYPTSHHASMLLRSFLLLTMALAAPAALAQSVPDWAAPAAPAASEAFDAPAAEMPPPPPPPVPVDGGLALLALAGAGLAARRLRRA